MIEPLRAWLLSLAGAALLTALAAMFPTSESLRRVVKLIGGVALTCLLFSPLVSFDYDSYAAALQSCRLAVQTDGAAPDCGHIYWTKPRSAAFRSSMRRSRCSGAPMATGIRIPSG